MIQVVQQLDAGLAVPCGGFEGVWTREGNLAVCLTAGERRSLADCLAGESPEDPYVPVLMWSADVEGRLTPERFWPVYEKSEDVELRYRAWCMRTGGEDAIAAPRILFESAAGNHGTPNTGAGTLDAKLQSSSRQQETTQAGGKLGNLPEQSHEDNTAADKSGSWRCWIVLEVKGRCGQCAGAKDQPQKTGSETSSQEENVQSSSAGEGGSASYLRVGPIHLYPTLGIRTQEELKGEATAVAAAQTAHQKLQKGHKDFAEEDLRVRMERMETEGRGEIVTFFRMGNGRPPLRIIFAGTKPSSLKLALQTMQGIQTPCLVLADTRLGGEGFFLGSAAYENTVLERIRRSMEELNGFTAAEVVLSGVSFGAAAAIYYGAFLSHCKTPPRAILLAEPILSAGTMALNEKFGRNGSFPPSLDLFLLMRHDFELEKSSGKENEAAKQMDAHMWECVREGDFSGTEIIFAGMEEDEYDAGAFDELKDLFANGEFPHRIYGNDPPERGGGSGKPPLRIYGVVRPGRHIAEESRQISSLTDWLERRYQAIAESMDAEATAKEMKGKRNG